MVERILNFSLAHRWLVLAVENTRPIAPDNLIVDRSNNPNSVYMAQAKQQVPCFESIIFASKRGLGQNFYRVGVGPV